MAVVAADLLAPNGPLDAKLFPGLASNELSPLIDGYILSAAQDPFVLIADPTIQDRMTRLRALEYAFTAVYVRMSVEPATVSVTEKGASSYITEQLRNVKALATQYRTEFESLIPATGSGVVGQFPGTVSTGIKVEW